jgi:2-C-methyl-D-erythritol 4-phosphate cytidylyltransferase
VVTVEGAPEALKVTTAFDLRVLEALWRDRDEARRRVGS